MLPESLLRVESAGDHVVPKWLCARDLGWVDHVLWVFRALEGMRRDEVLPRLEKETPSGAAAAGLRRTLLRICRFEIDSPLPPTRIREAAFERASAMGFADSRAAVAQAAGDLGLPASQVEEALYADLPGARRLRIPPDLGDASGAVERYNLALAQGLLLRAEEVRVHSPRVNGSHVPALRPIVHHARCRRLMCLPEIAPDGGTGLVLSGPLSVLRRTTKYGNALASFLPALVGCGDWRLDAACVIRGETTLVRIDHGAPLPAGAPKRRRFDSGLEERLLKDLIREKTKWRFERESAALSTPEGLVFPDFTAVHDDGLRVHLEIVGYWRPDYLARKARACRFLADSGDPLLICVDRSLFLGEEDGRSWEDLSVIWFERRVRAQAVLERLEAIRGEL